MSTVRAERWSDLECADGSRLGVLTMIGGAETLALDDSEQLTLTVAADTVGLALGVREVVRIVDGSTIREWRISQIEDSSTDPTVRVTAEPVIVDLATAGFLRSTTSGGKTYHALGAQNLTAGQYADTFVLANLTEDGLSWLSAGTYEPTALMTLAWDRWTRTQLLQAIVEQTRAEVRLRRNGATGYYLDILNPDGTGASATKVLLRVGRNLSGLSRTRTANDYASVIVPTGWTVNGAAEPATLEYAAWKITAKGTNTLTLADPAGGAGPIAYDEQLDEAYAVKPTTGALIGVVSSTAATQQIVLMDATGFAVGDHVEFRADIQGTHITGLGNPSAAGGRSVKTLDAPGQRGERQFVTYPYPSEWTTAPQVLEGVQAAADANPLSVTGLPAGTAIAVGDRLEGFAEGRYVARVTVAVTVTATGATSISYQTLSASSWANGNTHRVRVGRFSGRRPSGWTTDGGGLRRTLSEYGTVTCAAAATCVLDGNGVNSRTVSLKSLAAGTVLQPGDYLGTPTPVASIKEGATATATTASVLVAYYNGIANLSLTTGDAVTVYRPLLTGDADTYAAVVPINDSVTIPCPTIRIDSGGSESVWTSAGLTYYCDEGVTTGNAATPARPYLYLLDTDGTTQLAAVQDVAQTLTALTPLDVTLRVEYTATVTKTPFVKFAAPRGTAGTTTSGWRMNVFVRWVTVTLGPDPQVPIIVGSHANQLWQAANDRLAKTSVVPSTYRVSLIDLSRMAGYDVTTESLVLGGTIVLVDSPLGIDTECRIVSVTMNPARPEEASIVLDTATPRLTSQSQRGRTRSAVNIGTTAAPSYTTAVVDTTPGAAPLQIEGALRAIPTGAELGATSGAVTLTAWTAN